MYRRPGRRIRVCRGKEGDGSSVPSSDPGCVIMSQHQPLPTPDPQSQTYFAKGEVLAKGPTGWG